MAVNYNTTTSSSGGVASTSVTFAHTVPVGGVLVVGAGERSAPSGCTFNGIAMTSLGTFNNGASNNGRMFWIGSQGDGVAHNVVESHAEGYSTVGASSATGTSTSSAPTLVTNTGSSTTPSVVVTSSADSLIIDHCIHNQGTILTATGTGQTRRYNLEQANAVAGSSTTGAASRTVSYSCVGSNSWSIGAVSLDPVAGGSGSLALLGVGT